MHPPVVAFGVLGLLRQNFPAPPPSSSSAYASFLCLPPPTLRPLPLTPPQA